MKKLPSAMCRSGGGGTKCAGRLFPLAAWLRGFVPVGADRLGELRGQIAVADDAVARIPAIERSLRLQSPSTISGWFRNNG